MRVFRTIPGTFRGLPLAAATLALAVAGCADVGAPPDEAVPEPFTSDVEHFVTCAADGTSHDEFFVRERGVRRPIDAPEGVGSLARPLTSCSAIGPQAVAVIYVTWDGATGVQSTREDVEAAFFGADPSLRGYWESASRGLTTATGAVFGPYTLSRSFTCSASDLSALEAAAFAAADADVDFTQFSRVVVVSPQGPDSGCSIMGTSQVGCSQKSTAGDGAFTASTSVILNWYLTPLARGAALAAHELGHALGLGHANSLTFGPEAIAPLTKSSSGTNTEYGGVHSAMANAAGQRGHYDAPHEARIGWLDGRFATVEAAGTYHLAPYESAAAGAPQALKVRRSTGVEEWLWLEHRTPSDAYEGSIDPFAFSGLVVHQQVSATDTKSYALDLAPATPAVKDGVLAWESTFVDPWTGLTISAGTPDETGVDVTISWGTPTCVQAPPTVTTTPAFAVAAAGAPTTFTMSVRNNDAASCGAGLFQTASIRPAGWSGTITPSTLVIAPGQTVTATFTTVPAAAAVVGTTGSLTARAYRFGIMGNAYPQVFVCGAGAAPTLSLSPASLNVEASFDALVTGTVRNLACETVTLSPLAGAPSTWPAAIAPAALTLAPSQTGTFTIARTPPLTTSVGAYSTSASVGPASASATVNVTAPKVRVVTKVAGAPFSKGNAVGLTSTVTFGRPPVTPGTSVTFLVKRPSGQLQTLGGLTNTAGVASATYFPPEAGTFTVYSYAAYGASLVTSTLTSFVVAN